MPITTISSREFNQKTSEAKKAAEKGPVFLTDRGRTAHGLMTIESYEQMNHGGKNILDMLAMPEADRIEGFDEFIPSSRGIARPTDLEVDFKGGTCSIPTSSPKYAKRKPAWQMQISFPGSARPRRTVFFLPLSLWRSWRLGFYGWNAGIFGRAPFCDTRLSNS